MTDPINKPLAIITRTVVGLLVLVFAFGIVSYLTQTRSQIEQTPIDQSLPKVQVLSAAPVAVRLQWIGYGSVQSMDIVAVPARVGSTVLQIPEHREVGDTVQSGDLLAVLDDADFVQELIIAKGTYEQLQAKLTGQQADRKRLEETLEIDRKDTQLAKAEWERASGLYKQKAATQQDMDRSHQTYLAKQRGANATLGMMIQTDAAIKELEEQLTAQKSQIQLIQLKIKRCQITSPLTGTLQYADAEVGQFIAAGSRVASILSNDLQVALQLPSSARSDIRVGDQVQITPVGADDQAKSWVCTIGRIAPDDDPTTRTLTVYISLSHLDSTSRALAHGRYVQGTVYSHNSEQRRLAPSRSIQADQIMIVRDGRVKTIPANITHLLRQQFDGLPLDNESWSILGTPLVEGDGIILTPSRLVSDGKQVEPVVMADQATISKGAHQ
tara:strand:- start:898 stop:2220 length:1323 start_codon:yes stop_codon:yes gene_type:complete